MSEQHIENHSGIGRTISKKTNELDRVTPTILSYEGRLIDVENDLADNFLKKNISDEPTVTEVFDLGSPTKRWSNIHSVNFIGTSTSALYADLAEKYSFNLSEKIEIGSVVLISEDDNIDCKISDSIASNSVLGVISENPAYKMNSDLEDGKYVALKGRVPCYVFGPVKKGEPLVSYLSGYAVGVSNVLVDIPPGAIFAKALESIDTSVLKKIEVVI